MTIVTSRYSGNVSVTCVGSWLIGEFRRILLLLGRCFFLLILTFYPFKWFGDRRNTLSLWCFRTRTAFLSKLYQLDNTLWKYLLSAIFACIKNKKLSLKCWVYLQVYNWADMNRHSVMKSHVKSYRMALLFRKFLAEVIEGSYRFLKTEGSFVHSRSLLISTMQI